MEAAAVYGELRELPFPVVSPLSTTESVMFEAERISQEIVDMGADVVLCQGEFVMTCNLVQLLKKRGIKVLAACSKRCASEELSGSTVNKTSVFKFVKFREY